MIKAILAGLQHQIDNRRLATYLQDRDIHREALTISRPPRWTDTTAALASQIYIVQKSTIPIISHKVKHNMKKN